MALRGRNGSRAAAERPIIDPRDAGVVMGEFKSKVRLRNQRGLCLLGDVMVVAVAFILQMGKRRRLHD